MQILPLSTAVVAPKRLLARRPTAVRQRSAVRFQLSPGGGGGPPDPGGPSSTTEVSISDEDWEMPQTEVTNILNQQHIINHNYEVQVNSGADQHVVDQAYQAVLQARSESSTAQQVATQVMSQANVAISEITSAANVEVANARNSALLAAQTASASANAEVVQAQTSMSALKKQATEAFSRQEDAARQVAYERDQAIAKVAALERQLFLVQREGLDRFTSGDETRSGSPPTIRFREAGAASSSQDIPLTPNQDRMSTANFPDRVHPDVRRRMNALKERKVAPRSASRAVPPAKLSASRKSLWEPNPSRVPSQAAVPRRHEVNPRPPVDVASGRRGRSTSTRRVPPPVTERSGGRALRAPAASTERSRFQERQIEPQSRARSGSRPPARVSRSASRANAREPSLPTNLFNGLTPSDDVLTAGRRPGPGDPAFEGEENPESEDPADFSPDVTVEPSEESAGEGWAADEDDVPRRRLVRRPLRRRRNHDDEPAFTQWGLNCRSQLPADRKNWTCRVREKDAYPYRALEKMTFTDLPTSAVGWRQWIQANMGQFGAMDQTPNDSLTTWAWDINRCHK